MKKKNLHNITSSGFKTPTDYFESFEAEFFERLQDHGNFEVIDNPGFTVPKDYFNTVEDSVLETLKHTSEKPVIKLKSRRTLYYVTGIAASFALLFSLVFNTKDPISFDTIDTVLIENYVYQEDYTNDDFATLFKTNDISETDFIDINISDETLNQYFENVDTEDLIFE